MAVATVTLLVGPLFTAAAFALMVLRVEPFVNYFYLFAWYGLIFTCDCLIKRHEGRSLIGRCGLGFGRLMFWSATFWYFFELVNFRLNNWYYIFVVDDEVLRSAGTFLSFATVFPGILWIDHYMGLRGLCKSFQGADLVFSHRGHFVMQVVGAACIVLPMLYPTYFFPLIWAAVTLLVAPVNYRLGCDGLLRQWERGDYGPTLRLLLAGLAAGLAWEFLNFWARSKWIYTVPFFDQLKLFEMPVAGFLGFPPFAIECGVVYRFLAWHRLVPAFGSYLDQKPTSVGRLSRFSATAVAAACIGFADSGVANGTVMSVMPRIQDVEALSVALRSQLAARTIVYLTDLEGRAAVPLWHELEAAMSEDELDQVRRVSQLYLHQGIGVEFGNLLTRAGIQSVATLSTYSAAELRVRMAAVAGGQRLPSLPQIRIWVRRARTT